MIFENNKVKDIKIAYIGGGSRGWSWTLMNELTIADDVSGTVALYDIDFEAAKNNVLIGKHFSNASEAKSYWNFEAVETIDEALIGADFVIISILPGTFDEMYSDVHTPEKFGIYQSVGDTVGPGGIVRAMRTVPMFEYIAEKVKENCPNAWVINYTNPMTICVKTLYRVFPEIKAFGCCHEVFGTQELLIKMLKEEKGIEGISRNEIKVNPIGVNHFTWLTSATYRNIDLVPIYKEYCEKHPEGIKPSDTAGASWMSISGRQTHKVKMDLFKRFGIIAAAGDRHLAEFCEGKWYLESPKRVEEMHFALTPVDARIEDLKSRTERSIRLASGEEQVHPHSTGEEGVIQIRALLGLHDLVTNVNIPNVGQIPNLPLGTVVETNAVFRADSLQPVFSGPIPRGIFSLIARIAGEQDALSDAITERNVDKIFQVFSNDPLVTCSLEDAKKLFKEMLENTKKYLTMYNF